MSKECKVLYIIGIIFSALLLVLSILLSFGNSIEEFDVLRNLYIDISIFGFLSFNYYATIVVCMACGILMLILVILKKFNKPMTISIIVLSVLSSNIFGFISSIIFLVQNKRKVEKQYVVVNNYNGEKVIKEVVPRVRRERKPIKRLELKTSDIVLSTIGIVIGVVLIFLYLLLLLLNTDSLVSFFSLGMSAQEAFYLFIFVFVYALFVIVILLIPAFIILASIVFTILLIASRRKTMARIISIMGFVTLTIFNAIAAIRMLNRFNKTIEKEKDLIA